MKATHNPTAAYVPRRKRYQATGNIVNHARGTEFKTRDRAYDVGYLGKGGAAAAKSTEGTVGRVRSAGDPVWCCPRPACELSGMTIAELRQHLKECHPEY